MPITGRISPETAASIAVTRRKLDAIAAKATAGDRIEAKLAELEDTVRLLSRAAGDLTIVVTRLADQRLGDHKPTGSSAPADDPADANHAGGQFSDAAGSKFSRR